MVAGLIASDIVSELKKYFGLVPIIEGFLVDIRAYE